MQGSKRVLVSCGTKFHSDHVSWQLYKHGLLQKTITAHPPSKYLNRVDLPQKKVTFLPPMFVLPYILYKIPYIGSFFARLIDYRLPAIYDLIASFFIGGVNVSLTWSWASWYTIKKIKSKNGIAILEESGSCNQYQNELLKEEYNATGLKFRNKTPEHIVKRELREANAADYLLCPSQYVADSFIQKGIPQHKFVVIPYGVNTGRFKATHTPPAKFTVLFVGTIGVRKGSIYLFKALELLKNTVGIECILIGSIEKGFKPIFNTYSHLFTYAGRMPQDKLAQYYNKASVFVFPSLDEGMALVQLEAMASGLPIITTTNAGADAVITDGKEGFIVPIRDQDILAEKIAYLYNNPQILKQMALNAEKTSGQFTWDVYGEKLAAFINNL
jgi:glycosyltransferase involved in cell wall biosynthesis